MEKQKWQPLPRQGVRARIGICSDLHVCEAYPSREKLGAVFSAFYQLAPQLDAAAFVGDLTDCGNAQQYAALRRFTAEYTAGHRGTTGAPTQILYCMGNHDTFEPGVHCAQAVFAAQTGQNPCELTWVNLVPVIKLAPGPNAEDDYTGCYSFLKRSLYAAASKVPGLPIFVLAHHGIRGTAYATDEWYGNYGEGTEHDLVRLLQQYPQVIHVSGHSHAVLEDERSIDQSLGFTAIQDSTAGAYFENETGKQDPETGEPATVPPFGQEACQALLADVLASGKVVVRRLNLTAGRFCAAPWEIDIPALLQAKKAGQPLCFPYTPGRTGTAPVFLPDARARLQFERADTAAVQFPRAWPADTGACSRVQAYRIQLLREDGGEPVCRWIFSDIYRREQRADWCVRVKTAVPFQGTWRVQVCAATAFGQLSEPLCSPAVDAVL